MNIQKTIIMILAVAMVTFVSVEGAAIEGAAIDGAVTEGGLRGSVEGENVEGGLLKRKLWRWSGPIVFLGSLWGK
jgi:xanthine/CO dehydrogenase XdhC/CoxF family maturation factor